MKNVTVNIQIQFDVHSENNDDIKQEVLEELHIIQQTLERCRLDSDPLILTNSLDSSDIYIGSDEEEEI